jgi:hypothetical protein
MREGRPAETRFIDVAAGDTVSVALSLTDPTQVSAGPGAGSSTHAPAGPASLTPWYVATGVLGGLTLVTGGIAFYESRQLNDLRGTFPVSHDDLTSKSNWVSRFSLAADVLGVAALVVGGITLKLALSRSSSHEVHIALAPNGFQLAGTFR